MTEPPKRRRLDPAARRVQLLAAARAVFSDRGYRQTPMTELAAAAGVTPALFYRHFRSKSELFEACLGKAWQELAAEWDRACAEAPASQWLLQMAAALSGPEAGATGLLGLWFQATAEATNEEALRAALARQLTEVHSYVSAVIRRSQTHEDGIRPHLDADVEAWIFLSTGLLMATSMRVGGTFQEHLPGLIATRRAWLYGEADGAD